MAQQWCDADEHISRFLADRPVSLTVQCEAETESNKPGLGGVIL